MLSGAVLVSLAYVVILGTIVGVVRLDRSARDLPTLRRLRTILFAWHFESHPEEYRAVYAAIFPLSSLLLYTLAMTSDAQFRLTIGTIPYLIVSRLAITAGEVFSWSGMGYGIVYTFDSLERRKPLRLLAFLVLFLVAFSLLFLHLFGLAGIWPWP